MSLCLPQPILLSMATCLILAPLVARWSPPLLPTAHDFCKVTAQLRAPFPRPSSWGRKVPSLACRPLITSQSLTCYLVPHLIAPPPPLLLHPLPLECCSSTSLQTSLRCRLLLIDSSLHVASSRKPSLTTPFEEVTQSRSVHITDVFPVYFFISFPPVSVVGAAVPGAARSHGGRNEPLRGFGWAGRGWSL